MLRRAVLLLLLLQAAAGQDKWKGTLARLKQTLKGAPEPEAAQPEVPLGALNSEHRRLTRQGHKQILQLFCNANRRLTPIEGEIQRPPGSPPGLTSCPPGKICCVNPSSDNPGKSGCKPFCEEDDWCFEQSECGPGLYCCGGGLDGPGKCRQKQCSSDGPCTCEEDCTGGKICCLPESVDGSPLPSNTVGVCKDPEDKGSCGRCGNKCDEATQCCYGCQCIGSDDPCGLNKRCCGGGCKECPTEEFCLPCGEPGCNLAGDCVCLPKAGATCTEENSGDCPYCQDPTCVLNEAQVPVCSCEYFDDGTCEYQKCNTVQCSSNNGGECDYDYSNTLDCNELDTGSCGDCYYPACQESGGTGSCQCLANPDDNGPCSTEGCDGTRCKTPKCDGLGNCNCYYEDNTSGCDYEEGYKCKIAICVPDGVSGQCDYTYKNTYDCTSADVPCEHTCKVAGCANGVTSCQCLPNDILDGFVCTDEPSCIVDCNKGICEAGECICAYDPTNSAGCTTNKVCSMGVCKESGVSTLPGECGTEFYDNSAICELRTDLGCHVCEKGACVKGALDENGVLVEEDCQCVADSGKNGNDCEGGCGNCNKGVCYEGGCICVNSFDAEDCPPQVCRTPSCVDDTETPVGGGLVYPGQCDYSTYADTDAACTSEVAGGCSLECADPGCCGGVCKCLPRFQDPNQPCTEGCTSPCHRGTCTTDTGVCYCQVDTDRTEDCPTCEDANGNSDCQYEICTNEGNCDCANEPYATHCENINLECGPCEMVGCNSGTCTCIPNPNVECCNPPTGTCHECSAGVCLNGVCTCEGNAPVGKLCTSPSQPCQKDCQAPGCNGAGHCICLPIRYGESCEVASQCHVGTCNANGGCDPVPAADYTPCTKDGCSECEVPQCVGGTCICVPTPGKCCDGGGCGECEKGVCKADGSCGCEAKTPDGEACSANCGEQGCAQAFCRGGSCVCETIDENLNEPCGTTCGNSCYSPKCIVAEGSTDPATCTCLPIQGQVCDADCPQCQKGRCTAEGGCVCSKVADNLELECDCGSCKRGVCRDGICDCSADNTKTCEKECPDCQKGTCIAGYCECAPDLEATDDCKIDECNSGRCSNGACVPMPLVDKDCTSRSCCVCKQPKCKMVKGKNVATCQCVDFEDPKCQERDCPACYAPKCDDGECTCAKDPLKDGLRDPKCGPDQICCNGKCTSIKNSEDACGNCRTKCKRGEKCCDGTCKDVWSNDKLNCGECGNECKDPTPFCCNGQCCASDCCDGSCCLGGDCCGTGRDKKCCDSSEECCDGACCTKGRCCPKTRSDGTTITKCCKHGESCCDGECCPTGKCCDDGNGNKSCCKESETCTDNQCCSPHKKCGSSCCGNGQLCCNNSCCNAGEACCGGKKCQAEGHTCCGSYTCPPGEQCCAGGCCKGQCCDNKTCCSEGFRCCGGKCAKVCCGDTPCGETDKCCGDKCCSNDKACCSVDGKQKCQSKAGLSDTNNCGKTDCGVPCGPGKVCCDGVCKPAASCFDENNCGLGGCGTKCLSTEVCCHGECKPKSEPDNKDNCGKGGCGKKCTGDQICCDGNCVDPAEPSNGLKCGKLGKCPTSCGNQKTCCDGECVIPPGPWNNANCGRGNCGTDCTKDGKVCCRGSCVDPAQLNEDTNCGKTPCDKSDCTKDGKICCSGECKTPGASDTPNACGSGCTSTQCRGAKPLCCDGSCVAQPSLTDPTSCGVTNKCPINCKDANIFACCKGGSCTTPTKPEERCYPKCCFKPLATTADKCKNSGDQPPELSGCVANCGNGQGSDCLSLCLQVLSDKRCTSNSATGCWFNASDGPYWKKASGQCWKLDSSSCNGTGGANYDCKTDDSNVCCECDPEKGPPLLGGCPTRVS